MQYPPRLGFGTWQAPPTVVQKAVETALRTGYRYIDCAHVYENENEVGQAFEAVFNDPSSGIKREDVWITSKLWNTYHRPEKVKEQCLKTLKDLKLKYLDLFLIHWPLPFAFRSGTDLFPRDENKNILLDNVSLQDTWRAMEKLVDEGLVKHIGVSNYTVPLIVDILSYCRIKPLVNQIEVHPWLPNDATIKFCLEKGIGITAYSPMGGSYEGRMLISEDETVSEIARKKGISPQQVVLAWHLKKWDSPMYNIIPKSSTPSRVVENFECLKVDLTDEEMKAINGITKHMRMCSPIIFWGIPLFD
ncbi:Aldose reductase [Giardia muris]|uniref:Aldose reductase n=1 Tax=Giardia muris TaxID=5742 RepID=A0A4Z1T3U5_GIAMU|nr:Aldose reductase [Giardia muris]|eukprot:TNJ28653.1 Aldose reductase [Giardia muris]